MDHFPPSRVLALLVAASLASIAHGQTPPAAPSRSAPLEAPTVEVIGDTPLPGLGVPRQQVPSNVQAVTGADLRRQGANDLPDFLEATLPSVNVNQVQGNPYQADVNYRGFNASPRLGVPQGLSVYLDGVRINEPFGDIVNWDLIPQSAIANLNLIPGSNPLFGLNTLGGALSMRTKSGENFPGTNAEVSLGEYGRRSAQLEHGGSRDGLGWYVNGNYYREDGWRDFSYGRVGTLFGKIGKEDTHYDIDFSVLAADSRLTGNQLTPGYMLDERWESIYTYPDTTENRNFMANLSGSRWLADDQMVAANLYYRRVRTKQYNLDVNEVTDLRDPANPVVPFEEGPFDAQCDPGNPAGCNGAANTNSVSINRLKSDLQAHGFAAQYSRLGEGNNRLTLGTSYDYGETDFRQTYQLGVFSADRGGTATGAETESVDVLGRTTTWSLFATGTLDLAKDWQLTLSGRYNRTRVENDDKIAVAYPPPALGLTSDFRYNKFNPAIGLTFNPSPALSTYVGFNQGNRAPTPIELGCADPNAPCLLSNAVASDPHLDQVVARTGEAGVRGRSGGFDWNLGVYRTDLTDDILFVSSSTSAGYFTNFGKTRRQGIEAGLGGKLGKAITWSANYSLVDATFESSAVLLSPNNSSRAAISPTATDDDEILVSPGNEIPGIPRHAFKLSINWDSGPFGVGASLLAFSDQYVRGNENNQHQAGVSNGRTFEGSGKSPGYAVVNLTGRYRPDKAWELIGRINNLFDRHYTTGGTLGESAFPNGTFDPDSDEWRRDTFLAPGAPRTIWVGLRYAH